MEFSKRSLYILIVDDEAAVRHVLGFVLRSEGYRVDMATDGRAALRALAAQRFDLVISDFRMPQLGGDKLAAVIKAREPDLPVIILTGNADLLDNEKHVADAVLEKPFPLEKLRELVRTLAFRT